MDSVFELYKIGIGPSSSHTMGPMKAGKMFADEMLEKKIKPASLKVHLYGSLSMTGRGHRTDEATVLGLCGYEAKSVNIDSIEGILKTIKKDKKLKVDGKVEVNFDYDKDLIFESTFLKEHQNAMTIEALDANKKVLYANTYFSVGGGIVKTRENIGKKDSGKHHKVPFPFKSAKELLKHCNDNALSISSVVMQNELAMHTKEEIESYFKDIYNTMDACIKRGVSKEGVLGGGLKLPRRAFSLYKQVVSKNSDDPLVVFDWVNLFALAVSEENANGGRVVTAPTNGACGIIPATLAYYNKFVKELDLHMYLRYYLTSGAIGMLYVKNASISGAEVGCQGEVGVACSMAAAGLAELMGGNAKHVCMAAEIGMEHNLGLTCDPVDGLVQIPCIERNAIAAVKAINSARMALYQNTESKVSLDAIIATMYATGKDISEKYKETSKGGLALNVCHNNSCS
ncbi:L-serine ammonia-lyase [Helicobacter sp. 11S02629-2]|uniref:L-serine ammonia-lyase n=1 Tax=Helicobacter sp. 11S02629-2 TaxID=1476195 RepID=UPI000BA6FFF0|nr:L-serine ammonia-lyase [Helicobacter sp. 11S02629-2]PAF43263.1 L-serine ammonia-lyase [Helicobacter sp. 11S02629-2]